MQSRIAGFIAVVVVALGAAGYFAYDDIAGLFGGGTEVTTTTSTTTSTTTTGGTTATTTEPVPGTVIAQGRPAREPATPPDFAFRRLEIDTSQSQPEACLVFTRKLVADGTVRYEDYLRFDPEVAPAVRATEDRLCIAGLEFNNTYTLTIRAGLPAADGSKTAADETVPVELRDRPATVAFGNGFILPREAADGVPVTTVNVEMLEMKVVRVGDRLLSQLQQYILEQREFYEYDAGSIENEQGSLVWEGEMMTPGPKNQAVTTSFPLRAAMQETKPGVYLVLARDAARDNRANEYDWEPVAGQWIIDTDIGLTTFRGDDGLTVFARSFKTAGAISGVRLQLVARNNEILGEATTDGDGKVHFDAGLMRGAGGNQPVVVMAFGDGDFAYLDLRRPAFDLTDRGVDGRAVPGAVDAFAYTDRGIYRPGETVELIALLRDRMANALPDQPVTVIVSKPDGQEFRRYTIADQMAGGLHQKILLSATAARGRWQAAIYTDPTAAPVGRVQFDVQDFVPQKLKVTLTPQAAVLQPGQPVEVGVESRFLYGAPAAGLGGEGTMNISWDENPYPDFKGFYFGRIDERFDPIETQLAVATTDASGVTTATGTLDQLAETTLPLKATLRISIFEPGGRATFDEVTLPVRTRAVSIGVDPNFDYEIAENAAAEFNLVAVGMDNKATALAGATWELVRENYDYYWYMTDGQWRYERSLRDRIVAGDKVDIAADGSAKIVSPALTWGSYRLTVSDPVSGAATSVRFWAGWGGSSSSDRPDRIIVTADKPAYAAGDTARITVRPKTDGQALVVVASDKVFSSQLVQVSASGTEISIPISADWGAGAYVLVTAYRPLTHDEVRSPVRGIGVAWLGVDNASRTLAIDIGTPDRILPRTQLQVPITVASAGSEAYVTLAAIDEGVLQLTDFPTPDPVKYYFGKRRLSVDMRDDYGRLIEATSFQVGELRVGGDGFGGRGLAVVPQRVVALFTGPVQLDGDGKATLTLDIPDFNGELRLMAVAWTPTALGANAKPLTVRDPLVAEVVLPRFLAPGDRAEAGLNLHNVEGAPGAYTATITASGSVAVEGGQAVVQRTLAVGNRDLSTVVLTGTSAGIGTVTLRVEGPNGFRVERSWPIEIRPAQLPQSTEEVAELKPGETWQVPARLLDLYVAGTSSVAVNVTGTRGYDDVAGMLKWLDRYPYGCIEQTTSRAMPLLYFNDLALTVGAETDDRLKMRIQEAVDRVLDMQTYSGSFGMWSSFYDGSVDPWIGVFALDFLLQAKAKGYVVPNEALGRSLKWVRGIAGSEGTSDTTRAYAFYLLARNGQAVPGDLRYFADNAGSNIPTAIGNGMLGSALTLIGDRARSTRAFDRARSVALTAQPISYTPVPYGSLLRDVAGLTAMAAEAGETGLLIPLTDRTREYNMSLNYTTTQEKAWMLLAAYRLQENAAPVTVDVTGATAIAAGGAVRLIPTEQQVAAGVAIRNDGDKTVFRAISATGVPSTPLAAAAAGVSISKSVFTLDGVPLDIATMRQNDRAIVLITGIFDASIYRDMAVLDLLPAGWEIEGAVKRNDDGTSVYPWLQTLTPTSIQEARDDRFVAAFGIGTRYRDPNSTTNYRPTFAIAYVVRAVTPGTFAMPAAFAEDMYAPQIMGRTELGSITMLPPE